jgi:periplasmic protein TonB
MAASLADPNTRPQPIRITGLGLALTVNLAALLLMSLPQDFAEAPPARPLPQAFETVWIPPDRPVPIEAVPVLKAPELTPTEVRRTPETQPAASPVLVERNAMSFPAIKIDTAPGPAFDAVDVDLGGGGGAQVGYLITPQPPYPPIALRQGAEGTVVLRVLVGTNGQALQVQIDRSSGNRTLDRSARDHVLTRWRFEPARSGGRTVEAWALVPIDYRIPH